MVTDGQPGIPVFIDKSEPRIADAAHGLRLGDWNPANDAAIKLIRCLEAARDLRLGFDFLSLSPAPAQEKRRIKAIATPLWSLATGINDVHVEVQNSDLFRGLDKRTRRAFLNRAAAFRVAVLGGKDGPLKSVRDKIGAHIDKEIILGAERIWKHVDLIRFIDFVRICVEELNFLLGQDVYAWTRHTDDPGIVRLMNVDGTLVDLAHEDDELQYISSVSFVTSPRIGVAREINGLVGVVNRLVDAIRSARPRR